VPFVGLSKLRQKRGPHGLPIEDPSSELMACVAAIEARSGRLPRILEFITGVVEIFDVQVLPDIRRGEILVEQPSIVTMKDGMWSSGRPRAARTPLEIPSAVE
jgi:hypothetical protein